MIRELTRGGIAYRVNDTDQTASWQFWDLWASNQWEPKTFAALDRLLPEGGLLFDIGAWVGPITLWAAKAKGARVVAYEPDPVAYQHLRENLGLNDLDGGTQVEALQMAIAHKPGGMTLSTQEPGDSLSSLTRAGPGEYPVLAETLSLAMRMWGQPDVIKMDIEGGESLVLPQAGAELSRRGIPLVLSLHPQWYAPGSEQAMADELANWHLAEDLGGGAYEYHPKRSP